MSFKINCLHCNQRLEAENEMLGCEGACLSCGVALKIPRKMPNVGGKRSGASGGSIFWIIFLIGSCAVSFWFYQETKKRNAVVKLQVTASVPVKTIEVSRTTAPSSPQSPVKSSEKLQKPSVKQGSFVLENINLHRNKSVVVHYAIPLDETGKPGSDAHNIVFYAPYITERNFFQRDFHKWFPEKAGFSIFSLEIYSTNEDIGVRDKYYCFSEAGWYDVVFKAQAKIIQDFKLKPRKLLIIGESAGAAMAQQMGVHCLDRIDAIAMVGGGYFDPQKEKSKIAWLALNTWGCPGVEANRDFQKEAAELGFQVLRAETPPIWEKKGKQHFHHSPSDTAFSLMQIFIRDIAKIRDDNNGIVPPPDKWSCSSGTGDAKMYFPSKGFEAIWESLPHNSIRIITQYQDKADFNFTLKLPDKKYDRVVLFVHDPAYYESTLPIDNIYRIAELGAVCISVGLGEDYFKSLKNIEDALGKILKENPNLPVYVAGSGNGGMLSAVAALKNGDKRIKKIFCMNSPWEWPFAELSPAANRKRSVLPMEFIYAGKNNQSVPPANLPNTKVTEWRSLDGNFGDKWFSLLEDAVK
jgi:pimeloyl-ACP methyl ester carboxylesterase